MRKNTIFMLLMLTVLAAQPVLAVDEITDEHNGFHPYKDVPEFAEPNSHWSLYIEGGMSKFDGDGAYGIQYQNNYNMDWGIGVQYDFTPMWGLFMDVHRIGYGQEAFKKNADRTDDARIGAMYNLGVDVSFNFINAFFPHRTNTLFNVYGLLGGGLGVYGLKNADGSYFSTNDADKIGNVFSSSKLKANCAPFVNIGGLVAFNVTRSFSIGLKAYYDLYFTDYLDGNAMPRKSGATMEDLMVVNKNNDGIWNFDMVFRWNFNAKKDSHTRNYASQQGFNDAIAARKAAAKDKALDDKLNDFKAQKDTVVISHKDTLYIMNGAGGNRFGKQIGDFVLNDNIGNGYVYFENGKYDLTNDGQIQIHQMATMLKRNPQAYLDITGYCDNTGSLELNTVLAKKRSEIVRKELVEMYGIDPKRLVDRGIGIVPNSERKSFAPYRRVDMRIVDESEFKMIQSEAQGNAPQEIAPAAEPVADNFDTSKYIAVEVAGKSTTLAKLARMYYDNVNDWVYIYLANKERIANPSYLEIGEKLYIPILTDEQKALGKEEATALFEKLK